MKYNIVVIPDIHWGVIKPYTQLKELEFIIKFLRICKKNEIHIDLLVIAGDYFDCKLPLNSREAIFAIQWLNHLYEECVYTGVGKIRMFQGTMDHDNDQLDVFKPLEDRFDPELTDDPDYFKIFTKTTSEETLEGLRCIYCPDETITTSDYEERYVNEMLSLNDIGFFHGSFDVVYGELLASNSSLMAKKNVVFRYDLWDKLIKGPMVAGHWHDGKQYEHLFYSGSPFRWKFNEDEPKGISFIQYDTEDKSYYYKKIINPLSSQYITYEVYTNMYTSKEDYSKVVKEINDILKSFEETPHLESKLRVAIHIIDDKVENDVFITSLRQNFINQKNLKISVKNKLKNKIKKEEAKKNKERQVAYDFINDESKEVPEKIKEFVMENVQADVPLEFIQEQFSKYIK